METAFDQRTLSQPRAIRRFGGSLGNVLDDLREVSFGLATTGGAR
jgi:hypothetical protein